MGLYPVNLHVALTMAAPQAGWTALHEAVYNGHEDVARVLVEAGADANLQDQAYAMVEVLAGSLWCVACNAEMRGLGAWRHSAAWGCPHFVCISP